LAITQNTAGITFRYPGFRKLKQWLLLIIEEEGFISGEVSLVFCSDQFLLEINTKFLKRDYYTDVITFDYSNGNTISGDIFISIERIRENALKLEINFKDELDRVISHGILHLAGYKDSNPGEQKQIRAREDYYLSLRKLY
jgi:probable rRNA maturation factor